MPVNNFKSLEGDEGGGGRGPSVPPRIKRDVIGNIRFIEFIGNIVELYLPKVFKMFTTMSGAPGDGTGEEGENNMENPLDPSNGDDNPPGDASKGGAVSDDIYR